MILRCLRVGVVAVGSVYCLCFILRPLRPLCDASSSLSIQPLTVIEADTRARIAASRQAANGDAGRRVALPRDALLLTAHAFPHCAHVASAQAGQTAEEACALQLSRPSRLAHDLQQAALEAKVKEALQCDCVADLRDGVCGTPFTTGVVDSLLKTSALVVAHSHHLLLVQPFPATCAALSLTKEQTVPRSFWSCRCAARHSLGCWAPPHCSQSHTPSRRLGCSTHTCLLVTTQACMDRHKDEFAALAGEISREEHSRPERRRADVQSDG